MIKLISAFGASVLVLVIALSLHARPVPAPVIAPLFQNDSPSLEPTIPTFFVDLDSVEVGKATVLTMKANLPTNPNLIFDSVTVIRYNSNDQSGLQLGRLYDDGTHGDQVAGDFVFTTQITFNEPQPGSFLLKASVAYRGKLTRVFSQTRSVIVFVSNDPKRFLLDLAAEIDAGDLTAAAQRFRDVRGARDEVLQLSPANRLVFAKALRNTQFVSGTPKSQTYSLTFNNTDGTTVVSQIELARKADGSWVVNSW